jgi:hypothetical protein
MRYDVDSLVQTRMRIAEIRNSIRELKQHLDSIRFKVETNAIESNGGNYGKNAEERERFLKFALLESSEFISSEKNFLQLQNELEIEEARLDSFRDLRREIEIQQREKAIE